MTPRDREALERIIECADAISAYVGRVGAGWPADGMAFDAIVKSLEEIGECAKRVSPEMLVTMPQANWGSVKGMRDVLVHNYEGVPADIVVDAVENELPGLRAAVATVLSA